MSPRTWLSAAGVCGLLILMCLLTAWGQSATKGKKHALLVGVTDYDSNHFRPLEFTGNDAEKMAEALKKAGFDSVRVLTSKGGEKDAPTAANIRAALKELLTKRTRHDTVLVGLAGHGMQLEVTDREEKGEPKQYSYFCPKDASLQDISYRTGRSEQLILLDELFKALGDCDAGHRLALIDACRSDGKVKAARRSRIDVNKVTIPDGVGALFSCGRGQFAFETDRLKHGVFFHHVIKGLGGEASDRKGVITWDSLASYVKSEVPEYVSREIGGGASQRPASMGNLEGQSILARVDLVLPKKDGKKAAPKPIVTEEYTNSSKMTFKRIKAGTFRMGAAEGEKDAEACEKPQHEVTITEAFYLGVYEVTQQQWKAVLGNNPSHFRPDGSGKSELRGTKDTDDFPVESVSYEDVVAFIRKLNYRPQEIEAGCEYRLPTEAEWEYACRAGTATKYHFGNSLSSEKANFLDSKLRRTRKVGSYPPNAWGLYDMHGNVAEWCSDGYAEGYYQNSPLKDPLGPQKADTHVIRGGSWSNGAGYCRASYRNHGSRPRAYLGFRVVMVPPR